MGDCFRANGSGNQDWYKGRKIPVASGAKDPSEESMAKVIVVEERRRLGLSGSDEQVTLEDED